MVDSYYYGETNLQKQAYAAVVNTRFVQQFTNLGGGSSQFIISPQQGVSDIIVELVMPAIGSNGFSSATGYALPTGWGYGLVNRLSVRYGSSAQYFWSGSQMLLQNLMDCENNTKVDAILAQGGAASFGAAGTANGGPVPGAKAYLYLKLPHNSCRADGKPLPFASDLLVQPIVVTIELFAPTAVFITQTGATALPGTGPTQLQSAQLQVKQEMLTDTSDLLARRVDMNSHAYTFPLMYFAQQETQVQCQAGSQGVPQTVNLTGFRAGEVRSIQLWLTPNVVPIVNIANTPGSGSYLPQVWPGLQHIQLTYNGEIFSRFDDGTNQLWSLVQDTKLAVVNVPGVPTANGAAGTFLPAVSYWADCPFAQVNMPYDKEMKLMHGKPILNAVVNLSFVLPDTAAYTLHAQYIYNASLLCSRGSAEYIF